jgi:signal transduction histidine kinase
MANAIPQRARALPTASESPAVVSSAAMADAPQQSIFDDPSLRATSLLAFARFATGVIHEVNNPLGIALLSAQLARRHLPADTSPQVTAALDRVIYGVRTASEAVRTMLEVCRESEPSAAADVAIDVRDVLRFTALVMQSVGRRKGCVVRWHLSPEAARVQVNPLDLEIALSSLIYESLGAQSKTIELYSRADAHSIEIEVIDDGPGPRDTQRGGDELALILDENELVAAIVVDQGGILLRTANDFGGVTTAIRFPRFHEER